MCVYMCVCVRACVYIPYRIFQHITRIRVYFTYAYILGAYCIYVKFKQDTRPPHTPTCVTYIGVSVLPILTCRLLSLSAMAVSNRCDNFTNSNTNSSNCDGEHKTLLE